MAFDLLTQKSSKRDWSRESTLTTIPALPTITNVALPVADLTKQALALDSSVRIRPTGQGASVAIQRKWG
jgi:hypothetical protein